MKSVFEYYPDTIMKFVHLDEYGMNDREFYFRLVDMFDEEGNVKEDFVIFQREEEPQPEPEPEPEPSPEPDPEPDDEGEDEDEQEEKNPEYDKRYDIGTWMVSVIDIIESFCKTTTEIIKKDGQD